MKSLTSLLVILFSLSASAYEVPQDAVIKVFDSKGHEIGSMKRSEYKVVKLGTGITEQQVEDHFEYGRILGADAGVKEYKEQRAKTIVWSGILSGGVGKDGLDYSHAATDHIVDQHTSGVGMVQLCGTKNRVGLCAHATTNQFYGLGVKYDFN